MSHRRSGYKGVGDQKIGSLDMKDGCAHPVLACALWDMASNSTVNSRVQSTMYWLWCCKG